MTFGYSPDKVLYSHVDLGADLDSRVAIVGPNGAGKSTLLKLMTGQVGQDGAMRSAVALHWQPRTAQTDKQPCSVEPLSKQPVHNQPLLHHTRSWIRWMAW